MRKRDRGPLDSNFHTWSNCQDDITFSLKNLIEHRKISMKMYPASTVYNVVIDHVKYVKL